VVSAPPSAAFGHERSSWHRRHKNLGDAADHRVGVGLGGDQRVTNGYHEQAHGGNLRRIPRSRTAFGVILKRILEAAEGERLIPVNPERKVRAEALGGPRGRVQPGRAAGLHPEEFGRFLVAGPAFYRDHFERREHPAGADGRAGGRHPQVCLVPGSREEVAC
jgi:hypothetical protein